MLDDGIMNGAGKPGYGMSEERDRMRIQEGRDARRTRSRFQSDWTSACVQEIFFSYSWHGMVHSRIVSSRVGYSYRNSILCDHEADNFFCFPAPSFSNSI